MIYFIDLEIGQDVHLDLHPNLHHLPLLAPLYFHSQFPYSLPHHCIALIVIETKPDHQFHHLLPH